MIEFEWDSHNIKHIIEDYPERDNSIDEVESIFYDHLAIVKKVSNKPELRFTVAGVSNFSNLKVVVYTLNRGKIRPITCWPANTQTKRDYYERSKS